MKIVAQNGNNYILNFARGEEFIIAFKKFLTEQNITAGHFTGLGAADELDLAYYNLELKKFERCVIKENVEILSLTGNVARLNDEIIIHAHGAFSKKDLSMFGGHIFSLKVSGACEIHFSSFPVALSRAYNEETGLNLLSKSY